MACGIAFGMDGIFADLGAVYTAHFYFSMDGELKVRFNNRINLDPPKTFD